MKESIIEFADKHETVDLAISIGSIGLLIVVGLFALAFVGSILGTLFGE